MDRVTVRMGSMGKDVLEDMAEEHNRTLSEEIRRRLQRDLDRCNHRDFGGDIILIRSDTDSNNSDEDSKDWVDLFPGAQKE